MEATAVKCLLPPPKKKLLSPGTCAPALMSLEPTRVSLPSAISFRQTALAGFTNVEDGQTDGQTDLAMVTSVSVAGIAESRLKVEASSCVAWSVCPSPANSFEETHGLKR